MVKAVRALPKLEENKKFLKRQKYIRKKKAEEKEREANLRSTSQKTKRAAKKSVTAKTKTQPAKQKVKVSGKYKAPRTEVAKAKTGKTTLRKKKAAELVKQQKADRAKQLKVIKKRKTTKAVPAKAPATSSPLPLTQEEIERSLIERAIRGEADDDAAAPSPSTLGWLHDGEGSAPSEFGFLQAYAQQRSGSAGEASEDEVLRKAHQYFQALGKKERQLNVAAARRLREMKEINRRGGDKDGFRYVVPKSVKKVVRQMLIAQGAEGAQVDPDALVSTFGGDGVRETQNMPMRRHHKRHRTFSDFYQFQVSKRWTQNAEKFLNRGRANKSMFEAKKHQRSIKKL